MKHPSHRPAERVMIVDDIPDNLEVLRKILVGEGLEVRALRDPAMVPDAARNAKPDLILLDIMMPGLSGFQVCRRLKEDPATASIPVLYISALDDLENKVLAFEEGGVDYITKPFEAAEVRARVRAHLKIVRLQREMKRLNEGLEERLVREIEKHRQKEQMLVQQSRMAAMGEMLAFIGHQWRKPLSAVAMLVSCIRRDVEGSGPVDRQKREEIGEDCRLVQENLSFLSLTMERFQNFFRTAPRPRPFRLYDSIRELLELIRPLIASMEIRIFLEGDEAIALSGYDNELKQVVMNLVLNARDAIAAREEKQGVIRIRVEKEEGWAVIAIRDNGGGIPEAMMPHRLFLPYESDKEEGLGLGLYMSKSLVEYHMGGTLAGENREEGALFTIRLPLKPPGQEP